MDLSSSIPTLKIADMRCIGLRNQCVMTAPMRAERRRLKEANEKRAHDAREWEAVRAEKQMLGNLVGRLSASE